MKNYERMNAERGSKNPQKKRVAAYCRVSTDSRDQANSFESQQRYFREYIEKNPMMELVEIYADKGISGTNTKRRVAFNRMIEDAKAGKIDLIVTKEVSRFARNTVDTLQITRELSAVGVGVLFLNDNIDTSDTQDEFKLTLMASIAQQESNKTSERVKWGQTRRMEQGVAFGGSLLGYDVVDGVMRINEAGAEIVREIFDKYVNQEKGTSLIVKELREEGKKPRSEKDWNPQHIIRILRNEKYVGDLVQKKTFTPDYLTHEKKANHGEEAFIILKNHHEPIVSRELFDAAQAILDSRARESSKAGHSNRYCFSGKIVCGRCGARYVARYRNNKDGSRSKYWACGRAHEQGSKKKDRAGNEIGCSMESIREADALLIMEQVTDRLQLDKARVIDRVVKDVTAVLKQKANGAARDSAQKELEENQRQIRHLIDLCVRGRITEEELVEQRAVLLEEQDTLRAQLHAAQTADRIRQKQEAFEQNLRKSVADALASDACKEVFYRSILDQMIVHDRQHVDVVLKLLSGEQRYLHDTIQKTLKFRGILQKRTTGNTDVPISVSVARTRSSGMEYRWVRYRSPAPSSESGPPYCAISSFAMRTSGRVIAIGYSSRFS